MPITGIEPMTFAFHDVVQVHCSTTELYGDALEYITQSQRQGSGVDSQTGGLFKAIEAAFGICK